MVLKFSRRNPKNLHYLFTNKFPRKTATRMPIVPKSIVQGKNEWPRLGGLTRVQDVDYALQKLLFHVCSRNKRAPVQVVAPYGFRAAGQHTMAYIPARTRWVWPSSPTRSSSYKKCPRRKRKRVEEAGEAAGHGRSAFRSDERKY